MRQIYLLLACCLAAALVPFFPHNSGYFPKSRFPGWPTQIEGQPLRELPLTQREKDFTAGFPGRIARFANGPREVIIRWVTQPTRQLHPSTDCFKGLGYKIDPLPVQVDSEGNHWGSFRVVRGGSEYRVRERIFDEKGNSWADVSSWYWSAIMGKTSGPWWSVVVTERLTGIINKDDYPV